MPRQINRASSSRSSAWAGEANHNASAVLCGLDQSILGQRISGANLPASAILEPVYAHCPAAGRQRFPHCSGTQKIEVRVHRHFRSQRRARSEEHTSELQSLMRISYAVFCLKKKKHKLATT